MFWTSTLRELFREFAAARARQQDQSTRDVVLAWQVVRVYVQTQNEKRVPMLASLLPRDPSVVSAGQSYAEQRSALQVLSQMYGGPIVTLESRV